ncbi:Glycolate dehydrogenase, subunit GlcD [hydrothermal vent metagenome]|uniref:Glycolate dehydrogenase, subunit GlcD n=1 Tax=hydrothermal vent metagenome TaxID=652676 RepID=A0A3B1D181_9ZZZZ
MTSVTSLAFDKAEAIACFREIVSDDALLADASETLVYECDGYTVAKQSPDIVLFPETTEQVAAIVTYCNQKEIPFVPRGAGTSLAGGCLPVGGGVMIVLTRMNRILEINVRDRYAIVEPGVVNLHLTRELEGTGYHFAPDPSSQGACTIGGNVGANAGGPHTLKYGVTTNHVLGLEVVMPDGSIENLGSTTEESAGYDLTGLFVGSEGTLGICTKIFVRLTRTPHACRTLLAIFDSINDATETISDIIGQGIIPAALELMDQGILQAVEEAFHFGFSLDAEAILLIEVDGLEISVEQEATQISQICKKHSAREIRRAETEDERKQIWKCRKQAFGAIGRLSPSYCTQDGVVPRTKLPDILNFILECGERHRLQILNVFHAGDGNIHPILLFDERDAAQMHRVLLASEEILEECLRLGGSVTGEHGIGVEKISLMSKMFSEADLAMMNTMREIFNPHALCSPGKMLPVSGGCGMEEIKPNKPNRKAAL